jgi:hypothetical protein
VRGLALAAALAAAALLPFARPGAGVPIVAVLVAAAAASGVRGRLDALLFGVPALGLAAMPAVLDARWVVALDLVAAWTLASLAVSGPALAALAAPLQRLGDAPPLVPRSRRRLGPALRGAAVGGLLVLPFGALFWSGDAAFAELGGRVPLPSADAIVVRTGFFAVVLLGALGLALAARTPLPERRPWEPRQLSPVEWAIPLALLDLLFILFVLVQLAVLFGGRDHVLETAGLTYAEYARQGFWQLLAASALTLAVVGGAVVLASTPGRAHRMLLRVLLGVLCLLTLVTLASALHRLHLYEDAFGLTRQRLAAEAFAVWLGGLFALLIAAPMLRLRGRRLARVAVAGSALALLGFSLASPDRLIAERNVAHWRETGRIDVLYLRRLSADAVPVLATLPPRLRTRALRPIAARLEADEPWSSANLSRHRARRLLAGLG